MSTIPTFDLDPFSDELLEEPYGYYRELRDAGPVFQLSQYDVYGIARYQNVRDAFRDWRTFRSVEGIAFNDLANRGLKHTVLCSEPPKHDAARQVMTNRLKLSEMKLFTPLAESMADEIVAQLVERGSFDAAVDLAWPYVSNFVGELLGLPQELLDKCVMGSICGFQTSGPMNKRTEEALPVVREHFEIMQKLQKPDFSEGSIGWEILDAHEKGEIAEADKFTLLYNFMGPAFDTTLNAVGSLIYLMATHPDQWAVLKADPHLIPAAINETLRIESPVQRWSRFCTDDAMIEDVPIPAGSRVAIFPGSANRDERHYEDPDMFDISRNPTDHLAFGHGIHLCVGAPLARLEISSVAKSLIAKVASLEPAGAPILRLNNTTRGYQSVPVNVVAA